jgi:hypothetical protein
MMSKKINWKNHFVEFTVVVLGILMAFQLNQCSEENKQDKLIDAHLEYLIEEGKYNLKNLEYSIKESEESLQKLDSTIRLIYDKGDIQSINQLAFQILNPGYLYLRKNAYNSLINSGDIRFIKSFELKKDIVNMYEYYGWTTSFDTSTREAFFSGYFPYLKDNFDMVKGTLQKSEAYYDKKLLNELSTFRYTLAAKLQKFKDCKQQVESFLKKLEE